ncbi:MAG: hypothetical protein A2381_05520 [Bdellovibrionales bacterium RIFOXYB1_FULL_37_110]|nr:MAG: hypothetical protein A2381_05520 [Bdellovibrionales bacterium RIFOXYB1_FULL_37_110]
MKQRFPEFINKIKDKKITIDKIFFDSNILISYFHESSSAYDTATKFFSRFDAALAESASKEPEFVICERVLDEILEYEKRKLLSDNLKSLKENKRFRPSPKMIAEINNCLRTCSTRVRREEADIKEGKVEVFDITKWFLNDDEIKKIKRSISSKDTEHAHGWITFCKVYINSRISRTYKKICEEFIVLKNTKNIEKVNSICEMTGMGYSDSIIFQTFAESDISYIGSFDFDILYANEVLHTNKTKTVIVPSGYFGEMKYVLKTDEDGIQY